MRLSSEFIRLPLNFDVERLLYEANQFSEHEWDYHPLGYQGNTALSLVSSGGDSGDSTSGAMQATAALGRTPYVQQIMMSLGTVIGRSRFMRLAPHSEVPVHSDTDYAWRHRVRIHIPIITDPHIIFSSIGATGEVGVDVHMRAGEAWIFDNWREHTVVNPTDVRRIHLVIDTVGTAQFWNLAGIGWNPRHDLGDWQNSVRDIPFNSQTHADIRFENFNSMPVCPPDEIETMMREFLTEIEHFQLKAPDSYQVIETACQQFCQDWRGYWSLYWCLPENIEYYQSLATDLKASLKPKLLNVALQSNRVSAYSVVANWLDQSTDKKATLPMHGRDHGDSRQFPKGRQSSATDQRAANFSAPVFIVSPPRAGSTVLFEALKSNKLLWSFGDEIDREIESIEALHPRARNYQSNALSAQDSTPEIARMLKHALTKKLRNASGVNFSDLPDSKEIGPIRLIEKTLKNAVRIPFLKAMFPDAKFILIYRDPKPSIASLIDAWNSRRFISYSNLPINQSGQEAEWSLPLVNDWQSLMTQPVERRAAGQWSCIVNNMLDDLELIKSDVLCLSYESLISETNTTLKRACDFCGVPFGPKMQKFVDSGFTHSKFTLTPPESDKWRRHQAMLCEIEPDYQSAARRLERFVESL